MGANLAVQGVRRSADPAVVVIVEFVVDVEFGHDVVLVLSSDRVLPDTETVLIALVTVEYVCVSVV